VVLLFAAIYWVMPASRIKVRRALIGGFIAALLWELVRRTMVWYFSSLSMVNIIYGSAATIVFILLSFEAAAIILLLGAQLIAELERIDNTKKGIRRDR
jgi:YihY family inner membrane protein